MSWEYQLGFITGSLLVILIYFSVKALRKSRKRAYFSSGEKS